MRITKTFECDFYRAFNIGNHFSPENHTTSEEYTPEEIRDYFHHLTLEFIFDLEYFNYVFEKILSFCRFNGCNYIDFTDDFQETNWRFVDCVKYYQNEILIDSFGERQTVIVCKFNEFYIDIPDASFGG
jgi:hypothetical protein